WDREVGQDGTRYEAWRERREGHRRSEIGRVLRPGHLLVPQVVVAADRPGTRQVDPDPEPDQPDQRAGELQVGSWGFVPYDKPVKRRKRRFQFGFTTTPYPGPRRR